MTESIYSLVSKEVIVKSRVQIFQHNTAIIKANQTLTHLYYILDGRAKIYHSTEHGKDIFIHFLSANDWIGELTFLGIEEETRQVISIGETCVLAIPKHLVENHLFSDKQFLIELNRFIGKKLLDRTHHFVKNQSYDLKYRLATFMIDMSHKAVYSEKHVNVVDYLGTSYRHLLQVLKDFQDENYIEKIGQSTYRLNKAKLQDYYIH